MNSKKVWIEVAVVVGLLGAVAFAAYRLRLQDPAAKPAVIRAVEAAKAVREARVATVGALKSSVKAVRKVGKAKAAVKAVRSPKPAAKKECLLKPASRPFVKAGKAIKRGFKGIKKLF